VWGAIWTGFGGVAAAALAKAMTLTTRPMNPAGA